MANNKQYLEPAAAPEASGDYRAVRRLLRRSGIAPENSAAKIGAIVDLGSAGLNGATSEI